MSLRQAWPARLECTVKFCWGGRVRMAVPEKDLQSHPEGVESQKAATLKGRTAMQRP